MTLSLKEAREMVKRELVRFKPDDEEWVILDEYTIEKPWGWVFFYNSREYATTGNPIHLLVGNAPYIVNKETHEVIPAGTAEDIEYHIAEYEQRNDQVSGQGFSL